MTTDDTPATGPGDNPASMPDMDSAPVSAGNGPHRVVLGASCTIEDVAQMRGDLAAPLATGRPIIIDASRLERVDTAGTQLLAAFCIDCLEQGIVFAWKQQPPVLEEAIRLLGLGALMESPGAVFDTEGVS
ncbi:MAG: STAS domain-containing protein [Gammaproteobacteria bacterium]|nr:STAS domain-containing protein [Gammaproteobacteria bacterium]